MYFAGCKTTMVVCFTLTVVLCTEGFIEFYGMV